MPKINVYLPDELAAAVRDAQIPVSAVCQVALERAVRDVEAMRGAGDAPASSDAPFARFTPRARRALELAQQAARDHGHEHVETEHVLLGVLDEGGNLALKVLEALDVEPADVRTELAASLGPAADGVAAEDDELPFGRLTLEALETTTKEALRLGHNYIGCEHLLLGALATEDGLASKVLRRMGVELRTTRQAAITALLGMLHGRATPTTSAAAATPTLHEVLRRLEALESRLPG